MATIIFFLGLALKLMLVIGIAMAGYLLSRIHHIRQRQRAGQPSPPVHPVRGHGNPRPASPMAGAGPALHGGHPHTGRHSGAAMGGAQTRPASSVSMPMDDLAGRLLADYPQQVNLVLRILGWLGIVAGVMVTIVTSALSLFGWIAPKALRFWAVTAQSLDEEEVLTTSSWKDPDGVGYADPLSYDYDPLGTIIRHEIENNRPGKS
jgi:hypothetical protein